MNIVGQAGITEIPKYSFTTLVFISVFNFQKFVFTFLHPIQVHHIDNEIRFPHAILCTIFSNCKSFWDSPSAANVREESCDQNHVLIMLYIDHIQHYMSLSICILES